LDQFGSNSHETVEKMELQFWGVRGSIPTPGTHTIKVGGNTTCLSLELDNYILVFDSGTGIRRLGRYLEDAERSSWRGSLFLTHYHWDHIQGLPFFEPAFREENRFIIYGERKKGASIEEILSEQMQAPYFPVSLEALEGLVTFAELRADIEIEPVPGATLRTMRLSHPNDVLGYRFDGPQGSFCFITDHEHPTGGLTESVVEFARGVSVLIHDAQYTPEEKSGPKGGWGHSSWEEAALTAREAGVSILYLTHHDPERTDEELDSILYRAREVFPRTEIATESSVFDFDGFVEGPKEIKI
jgi:phosphoribosyl 1,2-cyclic phosphodiesterase